MCKLTPLEKIYDEMEIAEYAMFSLAELLRLARNNPPKTENLGFLAEAVARQARAARYLLADYERDHTTA